MRGAESGGIRSRSQRVRYNTKDRRESLSKSGFDFGRVGRVIATALQDEAIALFHQVVEHYSQSKTSREGLSSIIFSR